MPRYDFYCKDCKKEFTVNMTLAERDKSKPKCPKCNKKGKVVQHMTGFIAKTDSKAGL